MSIQCWKTVWFSLVLGAVIASTLAFGETPPPNSPSPNSTVFKVIMEKDASVMQGHYAPLSIRLRSGQDRINGFSFFIAFDNANIRLNRAEPGDFLIGYGWANFSVEPVPSEPGDSSAPIGLLRVTASVGAGIPPDTTKKHADDLVRLIYFVEKNPGLECRFLPIHFFWRSCEDNIIYADFDTSSYYVRRVLDRKSSWNEMVDPEIDCLMPVRDTIALPTRCQSSNIPPSRQIVVFVNGGVEMYCTDYGHPMKILNQ